MTDTLQRLSRALQNGNSDDVARWTRAAIDAGLETQTILNEGLIGGMAVVGERFRTHEIFLPDVLLAAKAMYVGMELLRPLLIRDDVPTVRTVVIGTVQGDLHDIGKNLVGIMLKGAGFDVIDLGRDVPPERFVTEAERTGADVIGVSALLTTTMVNMGKVINLARERGLRPKTKIIVGGAPLSQEFAQRIGADAYCFDGTSAVDCVKRFVSQAR
ncbi:MAG: corrinoid protein [Candidatus Zixiibacteriota bacterium]